MTDGKGREEGPEEVIIKGNESILIVAIYLYEHDYNEFALCHLDGHD